MKKLIVFLALIGSAFGQGGVTTNAALKVTGGPAPGAQVRVCTGTATGTPCLPLASIYSDSALSITKSNPFNADAYGNYSYFAAPGLYKEQIKVGTTTHTQIIQVGIDSGNASLKVINGIRFADRFTGSDWGAKVAAAISDLPSSGGVVDASGFSGAQSVSSSLTITKSNVTILLNSYTVALGTNQIIINPGVNGVIFQSKTGTGSSGSAAGAVFTYTGTNAAIKVGSSASDTFSFEMHNVTVDIHSANSSTAVGIQLNRTINYVLENPVVYGFSNPGNTQKLIDLEGSGNFTGGLIKWPYLNNGGYGIYFGLGANANTVIGGQIPGLSTGVGIYMSDPASGGNFIYGPDIENQGTAIRCGQSYNYITFRGEGNTKMVQLDAGATSNRILSVPMSPSLITNNSANSTNSFEVTGVSVPAWDGSGNFTLRPFLDSTIQWTVTPGSTADQLWQLVVRDHNSNNKFALGLDASQNIFISDGTLSRLVLPPASNNTYDAPNGAYAHNFNSRANSGTGGINIFSGGASPSNVASINGSGKGTFNAGVQPAATGTAITWFQKSTHASLDLASVASGACTAVTTETITGAALGDSCNVSSSTALEDGGFFRCAVTATDTAKWQLCNLSGGAIDRASDTYTIRVTR